MLVLLGGTLVGLYWPRGFTRGVSSATTRTSSTGPLIIDLTRSQAASAAVKSYSLGFNPGGGLMVERKIRQGLEDDAPVEMHSSLI